MIGFGSFNKSKVSFSDFDGSNTLFDLNYPRSGVVIHGLHNFLNIPTKYRSAHQIISFLRLSLTLLLDLILQYFEIVQIHFLQLLHINVQHIQSFVYSSALVEDMQFGIDIDYSHRIRALLRSSIGSLQDL